MKNKNPLAIKVKDDSETNQLIQQILQGNSNALNQLLKKHQDYIFNIALKMLNHVQDAEDVTQEVLLKIVSNLSKFDSDKAKFTTWAYRITFNHILNFRKSEIEKRNVTFDQFFTFIDNLPDQNFSQEEETVMGMTFEEARLSCTAGMLMCLNREQRLVYIIGEIFKINHNLAAEIFAVTPDNFRKKLSRTRKDIHQWMHKKCGLVNLDNPCRCKSKTKKFIELGIVNPKDFKWQSNYVKKVNELVDNNLEDSLAELDNLYAKIHRDVPFKNNLKTAEAFELITKNRIFSKFINLDNISGDNRKL